MLFSCKDDKPKIANIEDANAIPEVEIVDLRMTTSSNGKITNIVTSPLVRRFTKEQESYMVFPHGGYVESYDDSMRLESTLFAKYCIYTETPIRLLKAFDSVVVHNLLKEQSVYTDTLYWDLDKKEIYTDSYVKIVLPNMTLPSEHGMRSDERFTNYELRTLRDSKVFYDKDKLGKKDSTP